MCLEGLLLTKLLIILLAINLLSLINTLPSTFFSTVLELEP
jgi:hypothetical protein